MKKLLFITLTVLFTIISCNKFDDSKIWSKLDDHENRLILMEELCKKLNNDVITLQNLISALESNDYITNASPLVTGDGYTLIFKSGKSVVIHNGKDGINGVNGLNGTTPKISVKQDEDNLYYWTIDGEWLIVDGNKVRASALDGVNGTNGSNGTNGTNGINGKDGITPQFTIKEGYWYVSYNEGVEWEKLGKATGDSGLNGANGDSFFKGVDIKDGYVIFVLNDGNDSVIKVPLQKDTILEITLKESETLSSVISSDEMRTTTKLKVRGEITNQDMMFIQRFLVLEEIDLSEAVYIDNRFKLNPYESAALNRTLRMVWLPTLSRAYIDAYYSYCLNLEHIIVSQDDFYWGGSSLSALSFCPVLETIEYAEGVKSINSEATISYNGPGDDYEYIVDAKYKNVILPSTTETVHCLFLRYDAQGYTKFEMSDYTVTCKAVNPPTVTGVSSSYTYVYKNCILYVPAQSVSAYKNHSIWGEFNVLPIQ